MSQNDKFNDILNDCLDRMFKGETVSACLQRYPEQARELEPLLRTAMAARAFSTIRPRAEFKARARNEFQATLRDMETRKSRRKFSFDFNWRPQLRLQSGWAIALIAAIVVVLGGGSTVAAASGSMPDSALYSIKLAAEKVQLAVTPSDIGKAELNARFADRRVEEIDYMAAKGDPQEVQNIVAMLNVNLENITNLAGGASLPGSAGTGEARNEATFGSNATNQLDNKQPMLGAASVPATPDQETSAAPAPLAATAPKAANPDTTASAVAVPSIAPPPDVTDTAQAPGLAAAPSSPLSSRSTPENSDIRHSAGSLSPEKEKLKKIIIEDFKKRQARLEEALVKASPDVRPAIRQAIAQSQYEFDKAIRNLEASENR